MSDSASDRSRLSEARVGLLTTYRRNGEPVATPVSIAVRAGGAYFVTSATSGKARRLTVRPDVTLAPSTVQRDSDGAGDPGAGPSPERGWAPARPPTAAAGWPAVLELPALPDPRSPDARLRSPLRRTGERPLARPPARRAPRSIYRAVQLTARTSALLFAGAQAASALGPRAERASRLLYLAFMAAHAVHFTVVARYAVVNGGRDLFPGGRSLNDVGGWPTVAGIYTFFSGLAVTGWAAGAPRAAGRPPSAPSGKRPPGSSPPCSSASISDSSHDRGGTRCPRPPWPGPMTAKVVAERLGGFRPSPGT